jgi:hypothetical protein
LQPLLQFPDPGFQELGIIAGRVIRFDDLDRFDVAPFLEPSANHYTGDSQLVGRFLLAITLFRDQLAGFILKLDRMMLPCHIRGSFAGIMPAYRRAHHSWGRSPSFTASSTAL